MQNPILIPVPFAQDGNKSTINIIRNKDQDQEDATWALGFPPVTMMPIEDGGLPPKGPDFNGIFYEISSNLSFLAKGGRYKFSQDFADLVGGYAKGAIIQSDTGLSEYRSLIDGNKGNPNINLNGWIIYAGTGLLPEEVIAKRLETPRKFNFIGDAIGEVEFDGSKNVTCELRLPDITGYYEHGMSDFYPIITVDAKGRVLKITQRTLQRASINVYGVTKLNDSLISSSKDEALTANQGRILNETKLSLDQSLYKQKRSYNYWITNTGLKITRVDLPPQFGGEFTVTVVGSGGVEGSGSIVTKGATYPAAKQSVMQCIYVSPQIQLFVYVDPTIYYDNTNQRAYFYIYRYDKGFLNTSVYVDVTGSSSFSGDVTFTNVTDSGPLITNKKNELSFLGESDNLVLFYTPSPWPTAVPPDGYLVMMGQALTETHYPILFKLYGLKLPDMRSEFIRGWDNGRGIDIGRTLLSGQEDEFKEHSHSAILSTYATKFANVNDNNWGATWPLPTEWVNGGVPSNANSILSQTGGKETRPRNIAFNYIIKAG